MFVSDSFVHARWVEIQTEMFVNERPRELQRLSDTRWACRYASCRAVRDRLPAVLQLLSELEAGDNANRAVEARSLLSAIDAKFVITLMLMCDIFGRTQALSCMMQSATLDLSRAVDLIDIVRDELAENRKGEQHFDKVWAEGIALCRSCKIDSDSETNSQPGTEQPSNSNSDVTDDTNTLQQASDKPASVLRISTRTRRLPARFNDSIVMETVGDRIVVDSKTSFRSHVYLPVVDNLLSEFERRFDKVQCNVMCGVQALNPTSEHFADIAHIRPFAEQYGADLVDLEHELYQAKRLLERLGTKQSSDKTCEKPDSLVSFVSCIERYGEAFHELHRLGKIAVALPVSTASCERSFSALRHIKTWVRNSMSNSKLSSVAILAIERERALALTNDTIVDAFAVAHKNRRIALM